MANDPQSLSIKLYPSNGQMIYYECLQEILMIKIFLLGISNLFFCAYGANT